MIKSSKFYVFLLFSFDIIISLKLIRYWNLLISGSFQSCQIIVLISLVDRPNVGVNLTSYRSELISNKAGSFLLETFLVEQAVTLQLGSCCLSWLDL